LLHYRALATRMEKMNLEMNLDRLKFKSKFESWHRRTRVMLVIAFSLITLVLLCLERPIALGAGYHVFADSRTLLGIPNCLDVLSNIPFILAGVWGVVWLARTPSVSAFRTPFERQVFFVFFLGVACTGVGSFWYHVLPNNNRLPFDLLPMTCSFMAVLTAVIIERISLKAGKILFVPLLLLGGASVLYWYVTESQGHGDYRFYLFVQFVPPLLIGMMIALFSPSYTGINYLVLAFSLFVIAKLFELFDSQIYQAGHIISGHSLKHITAGIACYVILRMLRRRHAELDVDHSYVNPLVAR
jgi:preprotein translocase subunit SecG